VNLDFLISSPVAPGESIILCVRGGGAYDSTTSSILRLPANARLSSDGRRGSSSTP
jgi:hypothetical protein